MNFAGGGHRPESRRKNKRVKVMKDFSPYLQYALNAAQKAGVILKKGYGNIRSIKNKEGGNKGIVTEIDEKSEEAIIQYLRENSNYPIFTEEAGTIKGKGNMCWIIDPLDGTTNFARGIPLFAISIALLKSDQVQLGVVYNPIINECFYAELGKGAYLNSEPIKISDKNDLQGSVIFANHGYGKHDKELFVEVIKKLSPFSSIRKFGTTALELCYVAKGSAEAFLSAGDELWDYAAGVILIQEAGGRVTDWNGKDWNNSNSYILASNGSNHEELLKALTGMQS
ncbi:MAG: inositol monophosphatase [Candidatus Levybacteria bacterium]|nr:inositol monophosphatase [Candidatus Levybacteria bacterium]MBI3070420.1 inositol monophosphatase [Candidatus Levybacteria bacterium]MBI3093000.1 inositol monophosphatase [Candidatus Levybacteria bacterium]